MENHQKIKVGVAVAIVVLAMLFLNAGSSISDEAGTRTAASHESERSRERQADERPLIYKLRLEEQKLDESDVNKLLDHFKRTPESLVIAYIISEDPLYLSELKRYKSNKAAVMTLAFNSKDWNENLFWAKRLLEIDPDNGTGHVMVASNLLALGREEEALRAITQAAGSTRFDGNMEEVSALLPEVATVVPSSYLTAFVLDDLARSRFENVASLFPSYSGYDKIFSGKSDDEILSIGKEYLEICDKISSSPGFSISNDSIRKTSVLHECNSKRSAVLSAVERSLGPGASLRISPVSAEAASRQLTLDWQKASDAYDGLTKEQIEGIVDVATKASSSSNK